MSNNIRIEVSQADLKFVLNKLNGMETKAPGVFRNAVNRTTTQTMRKIRKGRQAYVVSPGAFNAAMDVKRANKTHMVSIITAKDIPHGLKDTKFYKTSSSRKYGVRAKVLKGGLKELVNRNGAKAFYAGVETGHMGVTHFDVFQRRGSERLPIKKLSGPGVAKMVKSIFKGKNGGEALEPYVLKTLHDEIAAEVAKLV